MASYKNCCLSLIHVVWVCLILLGPSYSHYCPCKIDSSAATADCRNLNLTTVPACVPRSIRSLKLYSNLFTVLHRREFASFKNLRELDFADNQIRRINNGSFQGLEKLKNLSVAYNHLHKLNGSTFIELSSLEILFLQNNRLKVINDYCFKGLAELIILTLTANKLMYLSKYSFHGLYGLKVLALNSNRLYFRTSLPQEIFRPLSNLRILYLEDNCKNHDNCTYFDQQISETPSLRILHLGGLSYATLGPEFANLRNLEELYLGGLPYGECDMKQISNKTFANLRSTPLSKISLTNCNIVNASQFTFAYLKHLTSLDLTGNNLCEWFFLHGLNTTNIRYLNLARTCSIGLVFDEFNAKWLTNLELEFLDISGCFIIDINLDVWATLPKSLKQLNLQNNYLDYVLLENISILENLLFLDLSHQQIRPFEYLAETPGKSNNKYKHYKTNNETKALRVEHYLGPTGLRRQHRSTELSENYVLQHNSSQTVKKRYSLDMCRHMIKRNTCFPCPGKLRSLNISNSELLLCIIPWFCDSNNSLQILKASGQRHLENLPELWKVMKNMPMLEELDLQNNFIKTLPATVVSHQTRLKRLWLSANSLAIIDLDLKLSKQLELIDLVDNTIQYASKRFISDIEYVAKYSNVEIRFQNNSFVCDCGHIDFVAWLRNTHVIFQKTELQCEYQNASLLSLSRISEIDQVLQTKCIAPVVTIACLAGFSFLTLLLILFAVAYYKRWNMKYLVYLGQRNVSPYHPLEGCNIDFDYDVYISYERDSVISGNRTLHELVSEDIYPHLIRRGFRVLIREELDIGMKLYQVISRALRKCENVVVLVTKDYCLDYWNVFEFNIAVLEGIYTKRSVVIPVIIDAVKPADLHEEIFTFLKEEPVPYFRSEQDANILIDYLCEKLK